ncbi:hypothetical protein ACIOD2_22450 [Amycolatopsis sp. NPDC088138]|uniref:DUF7662 domain-containing protein n=1 Tax=Amycolatopsis sp. NPDC088138 TaxID=3363938 RepID=UPI00382EEB3E
MIRHGEYWSDFAEVSTILETFRHAFRRRKFRSFRNFRVPGNDRDHRADFSPVTGKYEPLRQHLADLAALGRASVELTFAEVAALVDGLPASAFENRQWWANSSLTQAHAWRQADWHVDKVHFERQRVRFARGKVGGSYLARGRRPATEKAAPLTEFEPVDLDVQVRMRWYLPATVILDDGGRLLFPLLPHSPGIYRLILADAPGQARPQVYVGESEDLRRRTGHYRRPGPTQQTSLRINALLQEHLQQGGSVTMAVATSATVTAGGTTQVLSLGRKTARVLAEHATLAMIYFDGSADIVNRDKDS